MLNTEDITAFVYYATIQKYGWKRMAFIVQDEIFFTVVSKKYDITANLTPI